MEFRKNYTQRGFEKLEFEDDYYEKCSLQRSSSVEPHIWLGIEEPKAQIQWIEAQKLGLNLQKKHPECNEYGWCDYPIPTEVLMTTRMHLTRKQALKLAKKLIKFGLFNKI